MLSDVNLHYLTLAPRCPVSGCWPSCLLPSAYHWSRHWGEGATFGERVSLFAPHMDCSMLYLQTCKARVMRCIMANVLQTSERSVWSTCDKTELTVLVTVNFFKL